MDPTMNKAKVLGAIAPLKPADASAVFSGTRSNAGRSLPPYYLVYFLLVKLLGFINLGRSEKVAWTIPVEINGTVLMVEYRKLGLGIFIKDAADEAAAAEATRRICAGVKAAKPYFASLAEAAAKGSALNVHNNAGELFDRLMYFCERYSEKSLEAEGKTYESNENEVLQGSNFADKLVMFSKLSQYRQEARWYAVAAIEAFYSWTEHVFILNAILQGRIATGEDVARVAGTEWKDKFKIALDIQNKNTKEFYERLLKLRTQVRNFVAHGAFGKNGEALSFHTETGAVPLLLPQAKQTNQFLFGNGVDFVAPESIQLIHEFIAHLWTGDLSPAKIYIESALPIILSKVTDGQYADAMQSDEAMIEYVEYLTHVFDEAADMNW